MKTTYCYVAGKSAGHILPALALAKQTKCIDPTAQILFVSSNTYLDNKLVGTNKDINQHLPLILNNIPYRRPWRLPVFGWQLIKAIYKSYTLLRRTQPERITSTGGLIALPVCVAGWWLGIPIDLYELNAQPGSAIHWLSRLATHVYYCFDETAPALPVAKRKKTEYPLYISLNSAAKSYDELNFDDTRKTIFVVGGSQGSETLNQAIKLALSSNATLGSSVNIIHQIGNNKDQLDSWKAWYAQQHIPAYVFAYEPTCVPYYKLADMVICRAGAGTLFELEALQKPYITIPLETKSTKHQVTNAVAMARKYPELVKVVRQGDIQNNDLFTQEIVRQISGNF